MNVEVMLLVHRAKEEDLTGSLILLLDTPCSPWLKKSKEQCTEEKGVRPSFAKASDVKACDRSMMSEMFNRRILSEETYLQAGLRDKNTEHCILNTKRETSGISF